MAYSYCTHCRAELDEPSAAQILGFELFLCPHCNHTNTCTKSVEQLVLEMHERLEQLEQADLNQVVLAHSVELSLLPSEAQWLHTLLQNPLPSEPADELEMRQALFHKLMLALSP